MNDSAGPDGKPEPAPDPEMPEQSPASLEPGADDALEGPAPAEPVLTSGSDLAEPPAEASQLATDPSPPPSLQTAPVAEPPAPSTHYSPDGRYMWDGAAWVPALRSAVPAGATLSPDGNYYWNNSAWVPVMPAAPAAATQPPFAPQSPVQYSPDGRHHWNGSAWVPVTAAPHFAHHPGATNGMAVASLVLGVLSLFLDFVIIGVVTSVLAVVLGFIARSHIQQRPAQGMGLAIAGIVLGFVGLALFALIVAGLIISGVHVYISNNVFSNISVNQFGGSNGFQ